MGWTFQYAPDGGSAKAHCDKQLNWTDGNGTVRRVLKSAMVGSTYYAAVETVTKDGKREVWAAVTLTKSNKRASDGFTFGTKDMDETCGPNERKCPVGILDLLTPTESEWAKQWRKDCRENAARKRSTPKLADGQTITFEHPISFTDGHAGTRFRVSHYTRFGKQRRAFVSLENGGLYRISRLATRNFSVEA